MAKENPNKFQQALEFAKAAQAKLPKREVPNGVEPFVEFDQKTGQGTVAANRDANEPAPSENWDSFLLENGVSPEHFKVLDDTMKFRTWTGPGGDKMVHYSCTIVAKIPGVFDSELQQSLIKKVNKFSAKAPKKSKGEGAFVTLFSDWQIGKNEGGGTEQLVNRVEVGVAETIQKYKQYQSMGYNLDEIVIACLGDIVEGCDGFYAQQTYSVEYDDRAQQKIATELMFASIKEFARLDVPVTVITVPGNHGENRKNGKSYTTFMDNKDLAVAYYTDFAMRQNPSSFGHVNHIYPEHLDDDITLTYNCHDNILGFVHGHQFRSGGGAFVPAKAQAWHKNQKYGDYHIGYANILNFGHFHHYTFNEDPQQIIGAPALDGGSKWIEQTHGKLTKPGMLSYTVDKYGVNNLFKAQKKSIKEL
tara:strand:+ start:2727 stop:3980 length:1254 start_codon:yes stop_codon:yes gene_type:complete